MAEVGLDLVNAPQLPGVRFRQHLGDRRLPPALVPHPENQASVEQRIRAALQHIPPERLVLAPDCGMKYLPRAAAFAKLEAMASAARNVRDALPIATGGGTRP